MDVVPGNGASGRVVSLWVVSLDGCCPRGRCPRRGWRPGRPPAGWRPVAGPCRAAPEPPRHRTVAVPPGPGGFPASPCAVRAGPRCSASPRRPLDGALVPGKARRGPTARPGPGGAGRGGRSRRRRGVGVPGCARGVAAPAAPAAHCLDGACAAAAPAGHPPPAAAPARRYRPAGSRGGLPQGRAGTRGGTLLTSGLGPGCGGENGVTGGLQPKGSELSAASTGAPPPAPAGGSTAAPAPAN